MENNHLHATHTVKRCEKVEGLSPPLPHFPTFKSEEEGEGGGGGAAVPTAPHPPSPTPVCDILLILSTLIYVLLFSKLLTRGCREIADS